MNRSQIYYLIGQILSVEYNANRRAYLIENLKSLGVNWSLFISIGSNHLVLQTIYCKLLEKELLKFVPKEIRTHLRYVYKLNVLRNKEITEQVISINTLLGKHDIVPLYIKGMGNIIDNLYANPAERIMHDIDFMVPDHQWETSVEILLANGYYQKLNYNEAERATTKHYPILIKEGAKAMVEIHRLAVNYNYSNELNTTDVWNNKKFVSGAFNCYVMSDRHSIILNFIHSQLTHNGHLYAKIFIRNLYDLMLLAERMNPAEAFDSLNKYKSQAASYQHIMEKTFDLKSIGWKEQSLAIKIFDLRYKINLRFGIFSYISTFFIYVTRAIYGKLMKLIVRPMFRVLKK